MSRHDPQPAHTTDYRRWQDRPQAKVDDFTRALLKAQRESNARLLAKTAGTEREETLDPYGDEPFIAEQPYRRLIVWDFTR